MVEHAGLSCGISLLIVAVFAVLLHEKEITPKSITSAETLEAIAPIALEAPAERSSVPAIVVTESAVIRTTEPVPASVPDPLPVVVHEADPEPPVTQPVPETPRVQLVRSRVEVSPTTVARPAIPVIAPRSPRSAFAEVEAGERLSDVANRIYGTAEAVETLWRANRDQIAGRDDPIEAGIWLRTP